jgi:prefoldin subunit 5
MEMDNWTFSHIDKRLDRIEQLLINITKEITQMATTQAQLDAAITALGTVVTNVQTLITSEDSGITAIIAAVQALVAEVAAGGGSQDFTNEVTAINAMAAQITSNASDIQAQTATLATSLGTTTPSAKSS